MPSDPTPRTGRLTELDAMRGIAAFTVVLSHAADDLRTQGGPIPGLLKLLDATPLRALFNGRDAVIFFFVLSGLVLTRTLTNGAAPGFPVFAARRAVRLCVPAAAAVVFSALLYQVFQNPAAGRDPGDWLAAAGWTQAPSLADILRQSFMLCLDGGFQLDGVLWSLAHELRLSILLPLLAVAAMRWDPGGWALPLGAGTMLFGLEIGGHGIGETRFAGSPGATMAMSLFYLLLPAALFLWIATRLSLHRLAPPHAKGSLLRRWGPAAGCFLLGIVLGHRIGHGGGIMVGATLTETLLATLYFAPCFALGAAMSMGALARFAPDPRQRIPCIAGAVLLLSYDNLFAIAAASFLLILAARQPGRLRAMLRLAPFAFLGRISFSLYLVHVPLLLAMRHWLDGSVPHHAILLSWIVLSIPAACARRSPRRACAAWRTMPVRAVA